MNPYSRIPMVRPKRTLFKVNKNLRTTANIGEMIVSYCREMVPGDTFALNQVASAEFMPSIAPFKGSIELESCAFFVPYDQLAIESDEGKFSDILLSMRNLENTVPVPKWHFDNIANDTKRGTLWDYCGFPTDLTTIPDDSILPVAYLQRAYNKIYNEYVRDEFIDEEVSLTSNKIQSVCYRKDMFTTMSRDPQLGEAPRMKLSGNATVKWANDVLNQLIGYVTTLKDISDQSYHMDKDTTIKVGYPNSSSSQLFVLGQSNGSKSSVSNLQTELGVKFTQSFKDLLENNSIDLSNLVTFNIEDLRTLNRLQKWLERNALCGARTKEYLIANYGIAPNDETLDRPAFIGRVSTPVMVDTVVQTSGSGDTFQGTKTGNATGVNGGNFGKWLAKEFGVLMVVSWLRPKAQYSQGISRQWIKDSVFDFYNPIFEGLGMQPVQACELFVDGTSNDKTVIGYTDRYNDMRSEEDSITGYLRGTGSQNLKTWSVQRVFSSHPSLTSDFLHVKKEDYNYLFAIDVDEHPETPQCILSFTTLVSAIRPLHKFNMTHF